MRLRLIGLVVAIGALYGCAAPNPSALSYSVRTVPPGEAETAFDVAEGVLLDSGYQVAVRDRLAGRLESEPVDVAAGHASGGAQLRSARRRQIAEVRIVPTQEAVKVYCSVLVQQQTTDAHRWLSFDRTASDVPGRTPIEREAATTSEQNTVWETVRRDKAAERAILTAILERLDGGRPPGGAG